MSIYILNEHVSNGYDYLYISLISAISVFLGILVITAKNPVMSILFLIGLFVTVSGYLMLIGLLFMGLSYLLVYVGAVSILFIFILMLISVRTSELLTEGRNSVLLAVIVVFSFNFAIGSVSDFYNSNYTFAYLDKVSSLFMYSSEYNMNGFDNITNTIANVSSKSWDSSLIEVNHISSIGNIMYSNLFILLIITSLILLVAMVGAIVITIKKK